MLYSVLPSDEMAPDKYVIANWPSNVCQGHYICIHLERSPRNWIYTLMANSSEYVLSIHIGRKAQIQAMIISPGNLLKQWHVHEIIIVVRLGTFVFLPRDHVIYISTHNGPHMACWGYLSRWACAMTKHIIYILLQPIQITLR